MTMTIDQLVAAAMRHTLVFIGATAAGKDTIMRCVAVMTNLPILVSHTTRPMRVGETDGVEYHFVDNETFDGIRMIEKRTYMTAGTDVPWQYGLSEAEGKEHGLLVLDWNGFLEFREWREKMGYDVPEAVFVDVDKSTSRERQKKRGDFHEAEFERRWESDLEWVNEVREKSRWVWD